MTEKIENKSLESRLNAGKYIYEAEACKTGAFKPSCNYNAHTYNHISGSNAGRITKKQLGLGATILAIIASGAILISSYFLQSKAEPFIEFTAPKQGGKGIIRVYDKGKRLIGEYLASSGLVGSCRNDEFRPNYGPIPDSDDINGSMFVKTTPVQAGQRAGRTSNTVYCIESTLDGKNFSPVIEPRPGGIPRGKDIRILGVREGLAVFGDANYYNEPSTGGGIAVETDRAMHKLEANIASLKQAAGYGRIKLVVDYK